MRTRLAGHSHFRFVSFVFMAAMLAVAAVASPALAQGSQTLRSKGVDVDVLLAKAAAPAGVRVIVTLSGASGQVQPLQSASSARPSLAATSGPLGDGQAATVEQTRILATHLGADATKRQRWSPRMIRDTPYMAMTVTQAELEALAADPDVVGIHEDGQVYLALQDSVPLVGMDPAYNAGATGANQMVAILDSGVDFNHIFVSPRVTHMTCFSGGGSANTSLCPNGQTTQFGGDAGRNCGLVPGITGPRNVV